MNKTANKICQIIGMLLTFLLACVFGFLVFSALFSGFFNAIDFIILGLGIIVLIFLSVIVHEAGHLICGLISGYSFSSFRIGGIMWVKQEGKIHLRTLSIAGTGGQCLMLPPSPDESGRIPVALYNMGGVIANLFLCALFIIGYFFSLKFIVVAFIFLLSAIISMMMAVTNGIPLNTAGIANDGMNALHLSKNPDAAIAFRNQLLMNAAQNEGRRISEMPDEWFTLPENADMQNVHCASIAVFSASRPLDRGDTIEAERQINELLNSNYNIIGLHRALLSCDLIYCRLVNDRCVDVSRLLTPDVTKIMKMMKNYPSIIRTQFTIELLSENNEKKADETLKFFDKATKKFPYPREVVNERLLMLRALKITKTKQNLEQK